MKVYQALFSLLVENKCEQKLSFTCATKWKVDTKKVFKTFELFFVHQKLYLLEDLLENLKNHKIHLNYSFEFTHNGDSR